MNSGARRILVVDRLTPRRLARVGTSHDDVWYLEAHGPVDPLRARALTTYVARDGAFFWRAQRLAVELCEQAWDDVLSRRLAALSPGLPGLRAVYERLQVDFFANDFCRGALVAAFVEAVTTADTTVDYENNRLAHVHALVRERARVTTSGGVASTLRALLQVVRQFTIHALALLRAGPVAEPVPRTDVDILFHLPDDLVVEQFAPVMRTIREAGRRVAVHVDGRRRADAAATHGLGPPDVTYRPEVEAYPWHVRARAVASLGVLLARALVATARDPRRGCYYREGFLVARERLLARALADRLRAPRCIMTGEFDNTLNLKTVLLGEAGFKTELAVHGAGCGRFVHAFAEVDRLYVHGPWMRRAYEELPGRVGEYRAAGPFYVHRMYEAPVQVDRTGFTWLVLVFTSDYEDVGGGFDYGFDCARYKRRFLEYVLAAARGTPEALFLVQPHPRERRRGYVDRALDPLLAALPNVRLSHDPGRYASLRHVLGADLGLSLVSSAGVEMLYAGRRCLLFDVAPGGYLKHLAAEALILNEERCSEEEFGTLVRSALTLGDEGFDRAFPHPTAVGPRTLAHAMLDAGGDR